MSSSRKPSPAVSLWGSFLLSGIKPLPTSTLWSAPLPTFSGGMRPWRGSWRASRRSVEWWRWGLGFDQGCHVTMDNGQSNLCAHSPEWGGSEEVCAGLPDEDQTGGAAVPNPQGARRGEAGQVSRRVAALRWLVLCTALIICLLSWFLTELMRR